MNLLDLILIICFVAFILSGIKRGVIKEIVSLVGIILVFILSFSLKGYIGNLLCYILPFFKFTGSIKGLTTINIFLYQAIAFLIMFSLLMGVYHLCLRLSKIIQKIVNMTIILWIPSKILGGVVSLLKGYLIIYAVLLLLMVPFGNYKEVNESIILNTMIEKTPIVSKYVRSFVTSVNEVYDLTEKVAKKEISINEANLESLDIMLKYNIVSKTTIEKLIDLKKLNNIKNIESVIDNY